ncbi:MAG TPA: MFS transporter [Verrucomicrobiae bacterium]|nr:MFS transporter [Verrucomicrobiae bacterium]
MRATIRGLRWWIVALVCLGTIINYLARNSLAVLGPQLKETLHFDTRHYSYIVGAFQLAYTIMQPVCGWVIDHLGLRLSFALFAIGWSVIGTLHGGAAGWRSLAALRGLLGLNQACAIPAGVKAVAEWFPGKERSVAIGWFNAGTSLGALLAPPVVVFLTLHYNWRVAFAGTGVLGFFWAAAWWICYRSPGEHPALGEAELRHILAGRVAKAAGARAPAGEIVQHRRFWGIAIGRFLAEPAWQTFNFWVPLYLASERHMDLKGIALFAWLPFLAADLGGILGGYLSPILMRFGRLTLVGSRVAGIGVGAVIMIAPGCVALAGNAGVAIALFCLGGFAHQMISGLLNTLTADVFAESEVATANGLTGMASWTGGLSFSLLVGALAERVGYGPLFACLGVFDLLGAAILILLLRPRWRETKP